MLSGPDFICVLPRKPPTFGNKSASKVDHLTRMPLAAIDANLKKSQAAAFADGTLQNLTTQWVKYLNFFLFHGLDPLPIKEEDYVVMLSTWLLASNLTSRSFHIFLELRRYMFFLDTPPLHSKVQY